VERDVGGGVEGEQRGERTRHYLLCGRDKANMGEAACPEFNITLWYYYNGIIQIQ
jgi:hypothetical protein